MPLFLDAAMIHSRAAFEKIGQNLPSPILENMIFL
jgi:hypothetical protein